MQQASFFQKLWSVIVGPRSSRPEVIVHDPASSKPHDLDDPFFEGRVQEQVGQAIASAAQKNHPRA
jgi:hypothetical protein